MELTDEVRRAVRVEDCGYWGHILDFANVTGATDVLNPNDPKGFPRPTVRARELGKLPHITCTRCDSVWLVIDEPGADYDDAVAKVAKRLAPLTATKTAALDPLPVDGVDGRPIPLAPGISWDTLPDTHPAVIAERHGEWGTHSEVHAVDSDLPDAGESSSE